jgi:hypothetical protein
MNFEELKEQALLFVYWCNKLREGGFLEGGTLITEKGFDMAMDLVESGVKLEEKTAIKCAEELNVDVRVVDLIMEMQDIGYTAFVELAKKLEGMSESDGISDIINNIDKE